MNSSVFTNRAIPQFLQTSASARNSLSQPYQHRRGKLCLRGIEDFMDL